ncbi:phosphoenolpyruvate carboxykinase (ATP) [bacterium]|nr:phosphoenolpyruvate carboxykinase (ATP) [bacterium]
MVSQRNLEQHGLVNLGQVFWNLSTAHLYEEVVRRMEGHISHLGPMVVRTGHYTGRSPNDKFIVKEPTSEKDIWWGPVNCPLESQQFDMLFNHLRSFLQGRDLFVQDCYAGADPKWRLPIRVITQYAWQNLFARNMFLRIHDKKELAEHKPEFTIIDAPMFHAMPDVVGTHSEAFIVVHFAKRLILIGGTSYAGEIKKSVFTILNWMLPKQKVLPMHCSANIGAKGDTAIFFGLSGTGKTTLSADPERRLIGDDEHGWGEDGVFNFEGGCYAKAIRLDPEAEPEIYDCTRRFGTILENVALDYETRRVDLDDDSLTENTRAAYPITHIEDAVMDGRGGHPQNIIMLTADAFGVLPPVAKLTPEQAMYHFISGYTAKMAGTEKGLGAEPKAVFSACFGAPFMPLPPTEYAALLGEKIRQHKVKCWLINTGWTGGAYGVGKRISIAHTRAIVKATLSGELNQVKTIKDEIFGLETPEHCPGVPDAILRPANTWPDKKAFEKQARKLAQDFHRNFKEYETNAPKGVAGAGPIVS